MLARLTAHIRRPTYQPHSRMHPTDSLAAAEQVRWASQMVSALTHIHAKCIVHRDIKSTNVFFNSLGDVKIGDFGHAKVLADPRGGGAATATATRRPPSRAPRAAPRSRWRPRWCWARRTTTR